ncbi:DUF2975 domain-containing protein [Salinarimonas rosea]|uniref:DUF2975 domain-containing protein n=1 Tax=Salinarimonas rosea TaxID=552063 RepID=UPI0004285D1B|nr:DUF2975 domain-containing protein [Salinarimonas rosea]
MPNAAPTRARRIAKVSATMAVLTIVVAALQVVAYVAIFLHPDGLAELAAREVLPPGAAFTLTPASIAAGFVTGAIPVALSLYGLWHAHALFRGWRDGPIFTEASGRRLVRMGAALALMPAAALVSSGLTSLVLTLGNPPGQRTVQIAVSDDPIVMAIAGGLLVVVGWVMAEAARLAEENEAFV